MALVGLPGLARGQAPALPKPWKEPPPLVEVLKRVRDKDPQVRLQALETITAHSWLTYSQQPKEVVPVLLETLADDNVLVRRLTAETLHYYGSDPRVLRALIAALRDKDQGPPYDGTVAQCAADSLGVMGAQATSAVPGLLELARTGDWFSGPAAMLALGEIAAKDAAVVPEVVLPLAHIARDEQRHLRARVAAVRALGALGPNAQGALPVLRTIIRNRKLLAELWRPGVWWHDLRRDAFQTLSKIGPGAAEAVPDLIAELEEKGKTFLDQQDREQHRGEAAEALGRIGPQARAALPALREAHQQNVSEWLSVVAGEAIYLIEPLPETDPLLTGLLKAAQDNDVQVRIKALDRLRDNSARRFRHRPKDFPAIVSLFRRAIQDESAVVRRRAVYLAWCDKDQGLAALIAALKDPDTGGAEGSVAQEAAGYLGGRFESAISIPALMEAARSQEPRVSGAAIGSLKSIGARDRVTRPYIFAFLLEVSNDKTRPDDSWAARWSLKSLGPAGKVIVPSLLEDLRRTPLQPFAPGKDTRSHILHLLAELGPSAAEAFPDLVAVVKNKAENSECRKRAVRALGNLGRAGVLALPTLREVAAGDSDFKQVATKAITFLASWETIQNGWPAASARESRELR